METNTNSNKSALKPSALMTAPITAPMTERYAIVLILILILLTIAQTWAGKDGKDESIEKVIQPNRHTIEMSLFNWISKITIGGVSIVKDQEEELHKSYPGEITWFQNANFIKPYLVKEYTELDTDQVKIGKLILAGHLGLHDLLSDLRARYWDQNKNHKGDNDNELIDLISYVYSTTPESMIPEERYEADHLLQIKPDIENELGWIGTVLIADGLRKFDPESANEIEAGLIRQAKHKAIFFGLFFITVALGLIAGFISLLLFMFTIIFRKITFKLRPSLIPSFLSLEIFLLYLFLMNILFIFTRVFITSPKGQLYFTLAGTISLLLIIFWPIFKGHSLRSVFATLGITGYGWLSIKNIIIGPLFIAAVWPIFALAISLYQYALKSFNVDISKGEHPVVHLFLSNASLEMVILLFVFAVIVAPIVEEIMFRGALYGWLRSRYGVFASILSSSFIFAIVHPQGMIGILPLTVIGCFLAFLREWRGSLLASITAHATVNGSILIFVLQLR